MQAHKRKEFLRLLYDDDNNSICFEDHREPPGGQCQIMYTGGEAVCRPRKW